MALYRVTIRDNHDVVEEVVVAAGDEFEAKMKAFDELSEDIRDQEDFKCQSVELIED